VPTVLTFVNSHLAAFDEMVDRRNADFYDLSSRLLFHQQANQSSEALAGGFPQVDVSVFDADVLFWMGGRWTTQPCSYYVLSSRIGQI